MMERPGALVGPVGRDRPTSRQRDPLARPATDNYGAGAAQTGQAEIGWIQRHRLRGQRPGAPAIRSGRRCPGILPPRRPAQRFLVPQGAVGRSVEPVRLLPLLAPRARGRFFSAPFGLMTRGIPGLLTWRFIDAPFTHPPERTSRRPERRARSSTSEWPNLRKNLTAPVAVEPVDSPWVGAYG